MSQSVIIVGAGPAGIRAAQALVQAGLRPILVDEAARPGGQIYRQQPQHFRRRPADLYGDDAGKAEALHALAKDLRTRIDYRAETLAWNIREDHLHVVSNGTTEALRFDALILATGATDRLIPLPGWTLPGCYSLGAAQIALKTQACVVGRRPVFLGTGPLLYYVAYQYIRAGVDVAAVLDTAPFSASIVALPDLAARPEMLLRGLRYRPALKSAGVQLANDVHPLAIEGDGEVAALRYRVRGHEVVQDCDAVAMGYHLRPETQFADLAGCPFHFDETTGHWLPERDGDGRSPRAGIYLAGDGARVAGADAAESAGRLAALAALGDLGLPVDAADRAFLRGRLATMERFRRGLSRAFPWPAHLARALPDATIICRCEVITAGQIRETAQAKDAPEMNRAKALVRMGMGRCQGRYCGHAAAEILAEARGLPLAAVGRLRGQAPVKPLSIATVQEAET